MPYRHSLAGARYVFFVTGQKICLKEITNFVGLGHVSGYSYTL